MHYLQKNGSFLARLLGILANSNENYIRHDFQAFANNSGNFQKTIKFPENLQPYVELYATPLSRGLLYSIN